LTAQISDRITVDGRVYALAAAKGTGLFDPTDVGLHPFPSCTACWRGFVCDYEVREGSLMLDTLHVALRNPEGPAAPLAAAPVINGVAPTAPDERWAGFNTVYEDLRLTVLFSGEMLIGDRFIRELYVHMGFHPAWKYRDVLRLTFERGCLSERRDVSDEMAEMRSRQEPAPSGPPEPASRSAA